MRKSLNYCIAAICVLVSVALMTSCGVGKSTIDNSAVKEFEVEKYLGTWYEIARYDHPFERKLVGVSANYTKKGKRKLRVLNSGYKKSLSGKFKQAKGKAKIPRPKKAPAELKVSFFACFYADYFVMELDKDYQWAVVGSNTDEYLWILSRSPKMEASLYNELLDKIKKRGYDVSLLMKVPQK
ncbi:MULTISPECIES: lipocalin family protein [unclassified Saccharicrinis]|uniref:lipocalin family protein n=1 Tax=unclassified Saccharicrinis TaxID=2646859 RepID=UPI003D33D274